MRGSGRPPNGEGAAGGDDSSAGHAPRASVSDGEAERSDTHDPLLAQIARAPDVTLPPGFGGTDRYRLIRRLGEGTFGVVYEAEDRMRGGRVALKVLRHAHPSGLYRFKREFRVLAGIAHPNLVRLDELESDGRQWFFTMELVQGVEFLGWVRRHRERVPDAFAQLARGLAELHRTGKIHRDVKPSNVVVEANGRVVVLDFGLAMDLEPDASTEIAGTPLYMAPEQYLGHAPTASADCYAVGVMLFEALTGRRPFDGAAHEILAAKRQGAPAFGDVHAPEVLLDACSRLLAVDPAPRPTAEELVSAFEGSPMPSVREPAPGGEPFVGRESELSGLWQAFERACAGTPNVVLLCGTSGIGKSTLLRRFLDQLSERSPNATIIHGRCYERESVPYKALDGAIDELGRLLRRMGDAEARALLPQDVGALGQLFGVLRRVPSIELSAPPEGIDRAILRRRGMRALRELIGRLCERGPVVVAVDDLHWGDADSAALVTELLRPPDAPPLLVVGTYRAEEAGTSPLLSAMAEAAATTLAGVEVQRVTVAELSTSEAETLANTLLARAGLDHALARTVSLESKGNPLFLTQLVDDSLSGGSGVDTFEKVAARRIDRLGQAARRLLNVVALANHPIDVRVAVRAARGDADFRPLLGDLREARLIRGRLQGDVELVEPYHDRIRQVVVAQLTAEAARSMHLGIAEALVSQGGRDPEGAAAHFVEAGDLTRAFTLTVDAARLAAERLAFDHSADLFRAALELGRRTRSSGARFGGGKLSIELGEVLAAAGNGAAAADAFLAAAATRSADEALDLRRRAAELLLSAGHTDRGKQVLRAVMKELGLSVPQSNVAALTRLAAESARLELISLEPKPSRRTSKRELQRVDTLRSAVNGLGTFDPFTVMPLQAQHLREALRSGDRERVLQALVSEVVYCTNAGRGHVRRATRAREALRRLAAELGTPRARYLLLYAEVAVASFEGRWSQALDLLDRARGLEREAEVTDPKLFTQTDLARFNAYYWQGLVQAAHQEVPDAMLVFRERGNLFAWMWTSLIHAWVCCAHDKVDMAREILARAVEPWPKLGRSDVPMFWYALNENTFASYEGDAKAARRAAKRIRLTRLERALVSSDGRSQVHWALARASALDALDGGGDVAVRELDERASHLDDESVEFARAVAIGVRAASASFRADTAEAIRLLAAAQSRFERLGMEMMVAASQRARGRLLGGDTGTELVARSDAWMAAQGIPRPDRFCRMYLPGAWDA